MKNTFFAAAFCLLFAAFALAQADDINVIPKPRTVNYGAGSFMLRKDTKIVAQDDASMISAGILNEYFLKNYGFKLRIVNKTEKQNAIAFQPVAIDASGGEINEIKREKYSLNIQSDKIYIGGTSPGQFYGIQSLIQILPVEFGKGAKLPLLKIVDSPRFPYRGMHLDVARHFMPVSFVKKYIDLMAQYKFNQFHWHLTEDQGWRIEIKKYPKLTEIGSKRPESHEGSYSNIFKGDGRPVEGFYTQEEIRDVVAYAKARYINVIPEIELPGHASAALAAYPEFGCKADYKYEVKKTWGIFVEVFCPTDATFKFLEDVLDETIALFPDSPYIHIGGDEVLKDHWKESAFVQELKKRENLKDEHEVQSYFVRRIEKHINKRGKKMIGWDEILEGGLAPNATVMSWRGIKGGIAAAKAKHDVIMTPTDFAYFDYGQGDPAYEPLNIGGYLPLEKVYSYDPIPKELSPSEHKYIIGAQANIWTEYLETPAAVEYMAFPRMLALAEVAWSAPENKNFADFTKRMSANFLLLDKQNVNYRIPEPVGLQNIVTENDKAVITLTPEKGTVVIYTIDGSEPIVKFSEQYYQPLEIPLKIGETKTLKTIVINAVGRKSVVYTATIVRGAMRPPVEPAGKTAGVKFGFKASPESAIVTGETRMILIPQFLNQSPDVFKGTKPDHNSPFEVTFDGYINAPADGIYEFRADSTWGTAIFVDDIKIIDDKDTKDRSIKSAVIPLKAGFHKLGLRYTHGGGDAFFRVRYGIKGQGLRQLGGGELVH